MGEGVRFTAGKLMALDGVFMARDGEPWVILRPDMLTRWRQISVLLLGNVKN